VSGRAPREEVLSVYNVSRETSARLDRLVAELTRWQGVKNLVGPGTLPQVWSRHIADSLQLLALCPQARRWADLGSGAGFPGLVIAAALAGTPDGRVHLIESNSRKCAFLRHAARLTAAPAIVHESRIEESTGSLVGEVDVVTARAVAPLGKLLGWSRRLLKTGAIGLFPKGRGVETELTEAAESWRFDADLIPSRTSPEGRIVLLRCVEERV
jgi:16S rRNA (guanine527-N7)-methyltransferase